MSGSFALRRHGLSRQVDGKMSERPEAWDAGTRTRQGDLMDVDAALQSQIRNIETTYGRPLDY
jgi:hypothetical protein